MLPHRISEFYIRTIQSRKEQPIYAALNELRTQWFWDRRKIDQFKLERLNRLLKHAAEAVPYYKTLFQEHRVRLPLASLEDLSRIPPLLRDNIRSAGDSILATNLPASSFLKRKTGGSTAEPLVVYQTPEYRVWSEASVRFSRELTGYTPGRSQMFVWGAPGDLAQRSSFRARARETLMNSKVVDAFHIGASEVIRTLDWMERAHPHFLWAYAGAATQLARAALVSKPGLFLTAAQITAEVLTPQARRLISEAFHCPVFERYGSREVSVVSAECDQHEGMHILETLNHVEIVDGEGRPAPEGTAGRILVTNLTNDALPHIRYEIGDLGTMSVAPCSCGCKTNRLSAIHGRICDGIATPDGQWIHGYFFLEMMLHVQGVEKLRLIQEQDGWSIRIELITGPTADRPAIETGLTELIHRKGHQKFMITFAYPERMDPSASGKMEFIQSHYRSEGNPLGPPSPGPRS
ncbi:MAG: hypothetical protein KJ970_15330 [Candidatus Eisenbacteria bacterium]|uniref:Phenylacetate--CoA ligase family protein n=1 Tax=Eiseniibacteriota bacterium TaxID=2212470 RepID=A0A948RZ79_UNCEI|nr:hypothetical protein [Candidatus Eisenbacteria bacterium]MBU1948839.1 hypothetical protein [Candidatus Eisenbacteria bacterium]MBU2692294.1 hypothetical protein [Candidatus Eisenbacteria bacterium]